MKNNRFKKDYMMKISELENAPQWLLDANVKNEDVYMVGDLVTWRGGIWLGGTWLGGTWEGGIWHGGNWRGGIWRGGEWLGGHCRGGN